MTDETQDKQIGPDEPETPPQRSLFGQGIKKVKLFIAKGPFSCSTFLCRDAHGDEEVRAAVDLLPNRQDEFWPQKWRLPTPAIDEEGLPILCWREYDADPSEDRANAGINWAPRACFILTAPHGEHAPQFVSVSFDDCLPKFLTTQYVLPGLALLYTFVSALFIALYYFTSNLPLYEVFERLANPFILIAVAIAAGLYVCWDVVRWLGYSIRSPLLLNALVSRLIWRASKLGRSPIPLIQPQAHVAPWGALESFEIKTDPKTSSNSPERRRIRASFGVAAPETDIVNGSWTEDDAREIQRLLIANFLYKRDYYHAKIMQDAEDAQKQPTLLQQEISQAREELERQRSCELLGEQSA
ncbi:MAG: hypothetical protein ACLPIX_22720 [Rhodomicrobium sp.]